MKTTTSPLYDVYVDALDNTLFYIDIGLYMRYLEINPWEQIVQLPRLLRDQ
jgi:hypothetical protein